MDNLNWAALGNYKIEYMTYLANEIRLDIVAAYHEAGISTSNIYSIGKNAGKFDTVPIYADYEEHYNLLIDELECSQ